MNEITIENLVDGAIIEGFRRGTASYVESLETELGVQAVIQESGSAQDLLQSMINEQVESKSTAAVTENIAELDSKLGFLFASKQ
jgi:hypothetical protein